MPSWLTEFPQLDRTTLVDLRRGLDQAYRGFSREFGAEIEAFFDPLLFFLVWFEKLLINAPWWVVIIAVCALVWALTRSWKPAPASTSQASAPKGIPVSGIVRVTWVRRAAVVRRGAVDEIPR